MYFIYWEEENIFKNKYKGIIIRMQFLIKRI